MLKKEEIAFIPGTPAAVRAYSIKDYRPHWHSDCLEVVFILKGRALVLASYDRFQLEEVRELAAYMARFVDAKYIRPALRFTSASYEAASLK